MKRNKKEGICIFPQGGLRNTRTLFGNNPALLENNRALLRNKNGVLKNTFGVILFSFGVLEERNNKINPILFGFLLTYLYLCTRNYAL